MKEWFLTLNGETFVTFGVSHLFMLFLYAACVCLLLLYRQEIRTHTKLFNWIRWLLFSLLIGSEITYQTWTAIHGIWEYNLPFHLCGIASLIGAIALLTLNKKLIAITFFVGLIPAFLALLTPDLPYDFPNFRYFKFFIHHIAISVTGIFFAIISTRDTITRKSVFEVYIYLVLYALFVGFVINPWLDANYLFLNEPPIASTPLDWFGTGIGYRLNLGIIALLVFYLQWIGYRLFRKKFIF